MVTVCRPTNVRWFVYSDLLCTHIVQDVHITTPSDRWQVMSEEVVADQRRVEIINGQQVCMSVADPWPHPPHKGRGGA